MTISFSELIIGLVIFINIFIYLYITLICKSIYYTNEKMSFNKFKKEYTTNPQIFELQDCSVYRYLTEEIDILPTSNGINKMTLVYADTVVSNIYFNYFDTLSYIIWKAFNKNKEI